MVITVYKRIMQYGILRIMLGIDQNEIGYLVVDNDGGQEERK